MTVGPCTGPLGLVIVEDAHQAPMEDAGAHLQGGGARQGEKNSIDHNISFLIFFSAQEGTGGHPAPAGGGAPAQDTGGIFALEMPILTASHPAIARSIIFLYFQEEPLSSVQEAISLSQEGRLQEIR